MPLQHSRQRQAGLQCPPSPNPEPRSGHAPCDKLGLEEGLGWASQGWKVSCCSTAGQMLGKSALVIRLALEKPCRAKISSADKHWKGGTGTDGH